MNPVVWGRLPRDLLVLVLARLPVPEITRLRCQLSKEWIMDVGFDRACDEVNTNMAALVSVAGQGNVFLVRIFDFTKCIWLYEYRFRLTNQGNAPSWFHSLGFRSVWMVMASDGGLICFVSTWKYSEANPLCIVVMNLLTRVQHELPLLQHVYTVPPTIVHMKVDAKTKGYKVVVVGNNDGHHTVETYDSISRQWSNSTPSWGGILGCAREWGNAYEWRNRDSIYFHVKGSSPCAYDLEEGHLELFDYKLLFRSRSEEAQVMQYALAGDRMFVLQRTLSRNNFETRFYFITEFQSQNSTEVWVPIRTRIQYFPQHRAIGFNLLACDKVLMLRALYYITGEICYNLKISTSEWLSTGKWHMLPETLPHERYSMVCRVSWQVIP